MKLTAAQNAALRAIDRGEAPQTKRRTLIAIWRAGLIEDQEPGGVGWRLTPHGRLAMTTGRLMLTKREPEGVR